MTTANVTVLFTDIVGWTALAASMTPDAADELRREHFAILRQAVVEAGGTEVKQLGDGFMVVFPPRRRRCRPRLPCSKESNSTTGDVTIRWVCGLG